MLLLDFEQRGWKDGVGQRGWREESPPMPEIHNFLLHPFSPMPPCGEGDAILGTIFGYFLDPDSGQLPPTNPFSELTMSPVTISGQRGLA